MLPPSEEALAVKVTSSFTNPGPGVGAPSCTETFVTVIVPCISTGWIAQWYGKAPVLGNARGNVPLKCSPKSHEFTVPCASDMMWWVCELGAYCHVTVSLGAIVTLGGVRVLPGPTMIVWLAASAADGAVKAAAASTAAQMTVRRMCRWCPSPDTRGRAALLYFAPIRRRLGCAICGQRGARSQYTPTSRGR